MRLIKDTADAVAFVEGVIPTLPLDEEQANGVKAVMYSFAHRLRPDLNITETDEGIHVDTNEALS